VRLCAGFLFLIGLLPAQSTERNRISLSGGWGEQLTSYPYERQTAPVLGISYGYRPLRWFELEAGLSVALQPGFDQCSAHGCFDPNDRFIWVPFGVRFVAPIAWQRIELSAGGGALYERYSVSNPNFNIQSRSGWGGYFTGGAAVALSRHFLLGATPRFFLANPSYARDRWFVITGDVTFRF
jgi:hypothetical protein